MTDVDHLVARIQQADSVRQQLADLLLPGVLTYIGSLGTPPFPPDKLLVEAAQRAVDGVVASYNGGDLALHIRSRAAANLRQEFEQFETGDVQSTTKNLNRSISDHVSDLALDGHLQNPALRDAGLWARVADGNRAFEELAAALESRIRHFSHKAARPGTLKADEFRQECFLALHKAALKYRPAPGRTFLAFATRAMSNEITSAWRKEDGQTENRARLRKEFRTAAQALGHELGRVPRHEEIIARVGWGTEKSVNFQMAEAMRAAGRQGAADLDLSADRGGQDASAPLVDQEDGALSAMAYSAFGELDPLSQEVLQLRVVLCRSPLSTARQMQTTVVAVDRIEAAALSRLSELFHRLRQKIPASTLESGIHTHRRNTSE